jgi:hypothetical protein
MTKNQVQQRSERSQNLKVFKVSNDQFYVESSEGKICYRVSFNDESHECTCGDFSRNSKNDPDFKCKHILAVFNSQASNELVTASLIEKRMPKLNEKFITNIKGKDFVLYSGLLDLAHQKGLLKINVEAVQFPDVDNRNEAICKCTLMSARGEEFVEWGDANPKNVNPMISSHILRMAATRAKARALRDFTNIGITCLEELGTLEDVIGDNGSKTRKLPVKAIADDPKPPVAEAKPPQSETDIKPPATSPEVKPERQSEQNTKPQIVKPRKVNGKKEPAQKVETTSEQKPANGDAKKNESGEKVTPTLSTAQKNAIFNLARRRGVSVADLEKMSEETYGVAVDNLPQISASAFIRQLQQAA